jgi:hypothetical protein
MYPLTNVNSFSIKIRYKNENREINNENNPNKPHTHCTSVLSYAHYNKLPSFIMKARSKPVGLIYVISTIKLSMINQRVISLKIQVGFTSQ